jgi:aldehyde:ferredoxin oxidoreductase
MTETVSSFNYSYSKQEMAVSTGYHGRILRVDLTSGKVWLDEHDEDFYRMLVGGRSVIAYYLLKETPRNLDALSPENLLIFAPGVLTGTPLPGSGRHAVGAKSPLTGGIASSEAGGWWGAELKRAGLDGLVISGRAKEPVYLSIINGEVKLHTAGHIWGKKTGDVQTLLRDELNEQRVRIAQIGIAGEKQVRFASIMHDVSRSAGRAGLGAVMGSKNLKAIAVRGKYGVGVADKEQVLEISKWLGDNYKALSGWRVDMGTPATVSILQHVGSLPTKNYKDGLFSEADAVSGETMHATVLKERDTCFTCPIRCKQVVEINESDYTVDPLYGGPEYETLAAFGPNCCISDLKAICKANELCNAYGLDTISAGGTISFVMECFEKGILTADDTDGETFQFGDANSLLKAIELIIHRKGFGDRMAQGSAQLSKEIGKGSEDYSVTVKNLEAAFHDPRFKFGLGLGYAVAPMGADHMLNVHDTNFVDNGAGLTRLKALGDWIEPEPVPVNSLSEKKVEMFTYEVNWQHFMDCAVTCMFFPYQYFHLAQALSGAGGWEIDAREIIRIGKRANSLSRLFNMREGLTVEDDRLPKRFTIPYEEGPLKGIAPTQEELASARSKYYECMGWDSQSGLPMEEELLSLNISWAAEFLAAID